MITHRNNKKMLIVLGRLSIAVLQGFEFMVWKLSLHLVRVQMPTPTLPFPLASHVQMRDPVVRPLTAGQGISAHLRPVRCNDSEHP